MSETTENLQPEARQGALARLMNSIRGLVDPQLPVEDRRSTGRFACDLETSYVTEIGGTGQARVLDVSRRGLRLSTAQQLGRGMTVAVKPPASLDGAFPPLMARVMWTRKGDQECLCGLLLPPGTEDDQSWLEAYLASQGFNAREPQRRKHVRADSDIPGELARDAQFPLSVVVKNLSLGGALIRTDQSLEKNSHFKLALGPHGDLPELELAGIVLRQSGGDDEGLNYSVRFGPLEQRRHTLLKEYIVSLLRKNG